MYAGDEYMSDHDIDPDGYDDERFEGCQIGRHQQPADRGGSSLDMDDIAHDLYGLADTIEREVIR